MLLIVKIKNYIGSILKEKELFLIYARDSIWECTLNILEEVTFGFLFFNELTSLLLIYFKN